MALCMRVQCSAAGSRKMWWHALLQRALCGHPSSKLQALVMWSGRAFCQKGTPGIPSWVLPHCGGARHGGERRRGSRLSRWIDCPAWHNTIDYYDYTVGCSQQHAICAKGRIRSSPAPCALPALLPGRRQCSRVAGSVQPFVEPVCCLSTSPQPTGPNTASRRRCLLVPATPTFLRSARRHIA